MESQPQGGVVMRRLAKHRLTPRTLSVLLLAVLLLASRSVSADEPASNQDSYANTSSLSR